MKDADEKWIEVLRKGSQIDEQHEEVVDRTLEAALVEFRGSGKERSAAVAEGSGAKTARPYIAFGMGALVAAAVTVALMVLYVTNSGSRPEGEGAGVVDVGNAKIMNELEALFEARLIAVVMNEDGMDVQLAQDSDVARVALPPADQRVFLEFSDAGRRITALGYSGKSIRLSVEGRPLALMPLLDVEGGVILVSENAVFDAGGDGKGRIGNLKVVAARQLEVSPGDLKSTRS